MVQSRTEITHAQIRQQARRKGALLLGLITSVTVLSLTHTPIITAEDCTISVSAGKPVRPTTTSVSYSVDVTKNPCNRAIRSAQYDYVTTAVPAGPPPEGPYNWHTWGYGDVVHAPGSHSGTRSNFFVLDTDTWGYQEQVNGQWVWHFVGGDDRNKP
jgi:hypothetical protein